jgi:hypothetical protein
VNNQSVTTVALHRAIALLNAAKVEYAIRTPEGEVFGQLEIVVRKPKREPKYRHVNNFTNLFPDYPAQVRAMKPGDVLRWNAADRDQAEGFRSSLVSVARIAFGKGTCISTVLDDHVVELLRVE